MLNKRQKGNIGEDIACKFLEKEAFLIVDRNYQKVWGELDIVAKKDKVIHFFEVKSMLGDYSSQFFSGHKPEDNVHGLKVRHLRRMIETYLHEKGRGSETEFQFHVLCVFMKMKTRRARVKWIKNVIL